MVSKPGRTRATGDRTKCERTERTVSRGSPLEAAERDVNGKPGESRIGAWFHPARRTPHAIGVPTHAMWIHTCGQLIVPGQRGGVCRYKLRSQDSAGSVP